MIVLYLGPIQLCLYTCKLFHKIIICVLFSLGLYYILNPFPPGDWYRTSHMFLKGPKPTTWTNHKIHFLLYLIFVYVSSVIIVTLYDILNRVSHNPCSAVQLEVRWHKWTMHNKVTTKSLLSPFLQQPLQVNKYSTRYLIKYKHNFCF